MGRFLIFSQCVFSWRQKDGDRTESSTLPPRVYRPTSTPCGGGLSRVNPAEDVCFTVYIPLEVIPQPPGKGLLRSVDTNSPDKRTQLSSDCWNNQQSAERKQTPRMHTNHVPLNCTDRTLARIPSLAFPSLPTITCSQSGLPFMGETGASLV